MLWRHNSIARSRHLRLFTRHLRTQPLNDYSQSDNAYVETQVPVFGLATPREVARTTQRWSTCVLISSAVSTIPESVHRWARNCQESSLCSVSGDLPRALLIQTRRFLNNSVYNHYNRVRANLDILEEEGLGRETELDGSIDRMYFELLHQFETEVLHSY